MKYLFVLFLSIISFSTQSQEVSVRILEENTKDNYIFKAYNTLDESVEITFELKEVEGLQYDGIPVVLLIPAKDTLQLLKLKKTSKSIGFLMDYQQILIPNESPKSYNPEDYAKYNKGIVVFSRDGCARCNYTTSYLIEKKVDFTLLNFTQNPAHKEYMWDKLRDQGVLTNQVGTPIIMVDGIMSHSHRDLQGFVKELSKLKQ